PAGIESTGRDAAATGPAASQLVTNPGGGGAGSVRGSDVAAGVMLMFESAAAHSPGRLLTLAQNPTSPLADACLSRGTVSVGVVVSPTKTSSFDPRIST